MPNSVYSSTRGYSSRAARQTGRLDRAAEKSIIDPLRFRVAFYATLYAIPRLRIFGRVRVIRTKDSLSSSRPRPTEKEKERWNGSRATGKTMPRCCITFNELSFRFLKNERFTVWSGGRVKYRIMLFRILELFLDSNKKKELLWIRNNGNKEIDEFWGIKR